MFKRIAASLAILSLGASTMVFAQDAASVLERARERYLRAAAARAIIEAAQEYEVPWTPFIISFTPMISIPFGYYDTNLAMGVVGTLTRDVGGFMGSSVFNMSRDLRGFEGAGVFNMSDRVFGGQAAGVFNTAGQVKGVQLAGVFNFTGDLKGTQAAGVFNIAETMDGVQIAGLFNVADNAAGLQVGVVNIADTMDGVQLGLVNIARDGATGLGGAYDPATGQASLWWQNGTRLLYTVFSAEMPVSDIPKGIDNLVLGAGVGTRFGGRWNFPWLDTELLAVQVAGPSLTRIPSFLESGDFSVFDEARPFPELRLKLGIPFARNLALVGGVSVDVDIAGWGSFPEQFRSGYVVASDWFGQDFTAYARWFLGLKF